jgi:hypothetical protein
MVRLITASLFRLTDVPGVVEQGLTILVSHGHLLSADADGQVMVQASITHGMSGRVTQD